MSLEFTDELPLARLAGQPEQVLGKGAMNETLHFCSPAHGGWGVIRVACMLPETQLLFVCPEACGRHGAIASIEQGYRSKITYLCIDEHEIILGGYDAEIERAVDDIMVKVKPRPKAILLFLPCIDDLLAGDHSAAIKKMEEKHCLPIRLTRMNPIMLDNKMTPMLRVQRALYEFLPKYPADKKDQGIIVLGSFSPPTQASELAALMRRLGFGPLRHPAFCSSFEEFTALSQSAAAIVLRPEGGAAADFLGSERGIPAIHAPVAFDTPAIIERYQHIIDFLSALPGAHKTRVSAQEIFADAIDAAAAKLEQAAAFLKGASVAVDSTVTASPFSLALALVRGGIRVSRVYANYLGAHEKAAFKELADLDGSIIAANPNHGKKYGTRPEHPLADIAIGFEAGYATAAPVTVPLAFDEGRYGFEGFIAVIDAIVEAVNENREARQNLREQIKSYGLVV
ncbi:hypothetical protein AGMMS49579_19410 [Spirochaetia bacterium]|nr:hypothetical protein AGMMS49579_19410 [Spirochaetia bacterium]